jgi:hypothetical protein
MKLSLKQKIRLKKILELLSEPKNHYLSYNEIITITGIPERSFYRLIYRFGNVNNSQNEQKVSSLAVVDENIMVNLAVGCQNEQKVRNLALAEWIESNQFGSRLPKRTEIEQQLGGNMSKNTSRYQNGNDSGGVVEVVYYKNGNENHPAGTFFIDYTQLLRQNGVGKTDSSSPYNNYKEDMLLHIPLFDTLNASVNKNGNVNIEEENKLDLNLLFEYFWKFYGSIPNSPKKKALQAFKKVVKSQSDFQKIMQAIENQKIERALAQECGAWYAQPCHHVTWLNQARWETEVNLVREYWENEALSRMSPAARSQHKSNKLFKQLTEFTGEATEEEVGF